MLKIKNIIKNKQQKRKFFIKQSGTFEFYLTVIKIFII